MLRDSGISRIASFIFLVSCRIEEDDVLLFFYCLFFLTAKMGFAFLRTSLATILDSAFRVRYLINPFMPEYFQ